MWEDGWVRKRAPCGDVKCQAWSIAVLRPWKGRMTPTQEYQRRKERLVRQLASGGYIENERKIEKEIMPRQT